MDWPQGWGLGGAHREKPDREMEALRTRLIQAARTVSALSQQLEEAQDTIRDLRATVRRLELHIATQSMRPTRM